MTLRMTKDSPSEDREDSYSLGLLCSMKSRLAKQMVEDPKMKNCWGKVTTTHLRNTEIQSAKSKIVKVFEGLGHLWSAKSDWKIQKNRFSDKPVCLVFVVVGNTVIISFKPGFCLWEKEGTIEEQHAECKRS